MEPVELYKLALTFCGTDSADTFDLCLNIEFLIEQQVEKAAESREAITRRVVGEAIFYLCKGYLVAMRQGDETSPEYCVQQLGLKMCKPLPDEIQNAVRPPLSVDMSQLYTLGIRPEDVPNWVPLD